MNWIVWQWILAFLCTSIHCGPLPSSIFENAEEHWQSSSSSSYSYDVSSSFETTTAAETSSSLNNIVSSRDLSITEASADVYYSAAPFVDESSAIYSSLIEIQSLASADALSRHFDTSDTLGPVVAQLAASLLSDYHFKPAENHEITRSSLPFEGTPSSSALPELNTPQWSSDIVSSILGNFLKDALNSPDVQSTPILSHPMSERPEKFSSSLVTSVLTPSLEEKEQSLTLEGVSSSIPDSPHLVTSFRPFLNNALNDKKSPEFEPSSSSLLKSTSEIPDDFQFSFVASVLPLLEPDDHFSISDNNIVSSTRLLPSLVTTFRPTALRTRPTSRTTSHPQQSLTSSVSSSTSANEDEFSTTSNDIFTSTQLFPSLVTAFRPTDLRIRPSSVIDVQSSFLAPVTLSSALSQDTDAVAASFFDFILSSSSPSISEDIATPALVNSIKASQASLSLDSVTLLSVIPAESSSFLPLKSSDPVLKTSTTPSLSSNFPEAISVPEIASSTSSLVALLSTALDISDVQNPPSDIFQPDDFVPLAPNDSNATVDKIIEDLMNIIRPLNSQIRPSSSLVSAASVSLPLPDEGLEYKPEANFANVLPSLNLQPLSNFFHSKPTVTDNRLLSSIKFTVAATPAYSIEPTISSHIFPLLENTRPVFPEPQIPEIQGVLIQDEPTTTAGNAEFSSFQDGDNVADANRPEFSYFHLVPEPNVSIATHSRPVTFVSTHLFPTRRPVNKKPVLTQTAHKKPIKYSRPSLKPSRLRPTTSPPSTTTFKLPFLGFGEARPILLDLIGNTQSGNKNENSRLPSSSSSSSSSDANQHISSHNQLETVVGSTVLKLKGTSGSTSKPVTVHKPSLQFVSSHFDFDSLATSTSTTSTRLQPSTTEAVQINTAKAPVQLTTPLDPHTFQAVLVDQDVVAHSNVISTQSTVFIRPTPSHSSAVRQTIFHTVVSISDSSSGNSDEFAHFDDSVDSNSNAVGNVAPVVPSESSPSFGLVEHVGHDVGSDRETSKTSSTTSTTTTTTAPTTLKPTTAKRRSTVSTSAATRRPVTTTRSISRSTTPRRTRTTPRRTRTSSTKRPLFKPIRTTRRPVTRRRPTTAKPQSNPVTTSTRRPFRPAQVLFNLGYTLLPAAVIAAVIGLPLAVAGRKKRNANEDSRLAEMWENVKESIEEMSQKWEK